MGLVFNFHILFAKSSKCVRADRGRGGQPNVDKLGQRGGGRGARTYVSGRRPSQHNDLFCHFWRAREVFTSEWCVHGAGGRRIRQERPPFMARRTELMSQLPNCFLKGISFGEPVLRKKTRVGSLAVLAKRGSSMKMTHTSSSLLLLLLEGKKSHKRASPNAFFSNVRSTLT